MIVELSGDPRPAPRPRTNNGHAYMPQWYQNMKAAWALEARAQMAAGEWMPLCNGERVAVSIVARRATHKIADADNLAKSVMDTANGLLWSDDAQIDQLYIRVLRGVGNNAAGVFVAAWECGPARPEFVPIADDWVGV